MKKDQYIMIKVTEKEKEKIKKDAIKRGLSVSAYIRLITLEGKK